MLNFNPVVYDKNLTVLQIGDYVKIESFDNHIVMGFITHITESSNNIWVNNFYWSPASAATKITKEEYILWKLEN